MTHFLGLNNLLEWFTELRNPIFSLSYQFITKDIKGYTDEQPNEGIHRARSQTKELPSSWILGPSTVAHGSVLVPQRGSSPKPLLWAFFGGLIT